MTFEQLHAIYESQGGRCAICRRPGNPPAHGHGAGKTTLHVDHDHASGRVRGLLCSLCNTGIGAFSESPEALQAALAYLRDAAKEGADDLSL
jgi:hypothetical protein